VQKSKNHALNAALLSNTTLRHSTGWIDARFVSPDSYGTLFREAKEKYVKAFSERYSLNNERQLQHQYLKAYRIRVIGKVRGVGFRRTVQQRAWEFGIVGTVENLPDGTVQIEAQGENEKLGEFIGSLRAVELPAVVTNVEKSEIKILKTRKIFKINLGSSAEEFEEGLSAGQEQLGLLRKDFAQFTTATTTNFATLANRYDKISDALEVLTGQTKQFTEALSTLTQLAKDYFDERRAERQTRGHNSDL
jgi:acylphosphatase